MSKETFAPTQHPKTFIGGDIILSFNVLNAYNLLFF